MEENLSEAERRIEKYLDLDLSWPDLHKMSFFEIQTILKKCTWLESLDLSNNQIGDISFLKDFRNLKSLNLCDTQISDISFLKDFKQINSLDLSDNRLINDCTFLKDLTGITKLALRYNYIVDYTFLKDLEKLSDLDLTGNHISDFSFLQDLKQLNSLDLSSNQITDISFVVDLRQLTKLALSQNDIEDFSSLNFLVKLTHLEIHSNYNSKGYKILPSIKDLKQLTSLDISFNQISDISYLKDLKQLSELLLNVNQISDISYLKDLKQLTSLNISVNQINDISYLKDLKQLTELNLSKNPIKYIPKEIYNQYECSKDLFSYWREIENSQKVTNNQLKIIFLGDGCTGKTTLLHWFIDNEFKDIDLNLRTHGVIIKPLPLNEGRILGNFWDFGGQEVYHATYRLFLGKRTLYILVWSTETPENEKETRNHPHYWLDMIADIADKSERSRVLIVQNIFENQKEIHLLSNEEIEDYSKRGLDISFQSVNAKIGTRIKQFKLSIEEEAENLINENVEELPETWINIRTRVAELREAKNKTLNVSDFQQICEECKLTTDFKIALDYLHNAGEVFYYANKFNNQIILDQEWALEAVYAVLKKDKVERFKGEFTLEDLINIWKEKNHDLREEEVGIFLNFMLSNQIMFSTNESNYIDDNRKFVIPQLLPEEFPFQLEALKNNSSSLKHRIEYEFLHRDIIERFIIRTAQFSVKKTFWKNGVFIKYENAFAIIEVVEEAKEKKINIECFGAGKEKILQRIREEFNKIRPFTKSKEFRFVSGHWVSSTDKLESKDLDKSGFEYESLGEISNLKAVKDQVNVLVGEAKTKEAIELIQKWAKVSNNSELQFTVTMIKADWSRIKKNEIIGITESIESRYSSINKRILELDWCGDT